ncbi:MAG: PaaI family thioesterase [Alphaproteobacteria bacterium]|nr:PaaI family thioesterase [Alphaproteobacteria bacterium]
MTARVSVEEMNRVMIEELTLMGDLGARFESVGNGRAVARLPYAETLLRPGGTISGPAMMGLADAALYGAVLSRIGLVKLAVTTSLTTNFLRRPRPADVIAVATLIKCGKRLAYGEVTITTSAEPDDPVAHVTGTYSIPPSGR